MAMSGSFVGVRILTELMTPSEFGKLALGMTAATFVQQLAMGPLASGALRYYSPSVEKSELFCYLSAVRESTAWITKVIVLSFLLFSLVLTITKYFGWLPLLISVLFFAIFNGYNSIINGIQNAARHRSIVALHRGLQSWSRVLFAAAFILVFGSESYVAMTGYAVGLTLVLISQLFFFRKIIPSDTTSILDSVKEYRDKIWRYSWPFIIWGFFQWARVSSDRWALATFMSESDVGLYAVLLQLGYSPMSRLTVMITQLLSPIFFQRAGAADDVLRLENIQKAIFHIVLFGIIVTSIVFFMTYLSHRYIFSFLVHEKYHSVSYLLPWVLLAGGLFAMAQISSISLTSQMKTKVLLLPKVCTCAAGVGFNFIGAYWGGIEGVVVAWILFSLLNLSWILILSLKHSYYYNLKLANQ